jgi:hypothetical protein
MHRQPRGLDRLDEFMAECCNLVTQLLQPDDARVGSEEFDQENPPTLIARRFRAIGA